MKIEKEIDELILDISENPDLFEVRFGELVNLIKNSKIKGKFNLILNDQELTDIINNLSLNNDTSKLKNYLSDSFKAIRKSFTEMKNFSECSLGLVVNDPLLVESDVPGNILYNSDTRKILVTKNFGYIIDKSGSNYQIKKHSITGDIHNFSNWKLINKQIVAKELLSNVLV